MITTIDCQLNSLLENCLKIQLVEFGWADVLGFSQENDWLMSYKLQWGETFYEHPLSLSWNILLYENVPRKHL